MSDAASFDQWYADMAVGSVQRDRLREEHLGLPATVQSSSLLPWDGIAAIVEGLRVAAGGRLLDLGCGRGGYGLEVARRTGARLIGVDFSVVALEEARRQVDSLDATFEVGELTAIPLPDRSVDAVMCVDALQFAEPRTAALAEIHRVLVPGGRVAVSCWEPRPGAEDLHPRMQGIDLTAELRDTGFATVQVTEQPGWHAQERALWEAAVAADARDAAMQSMQGEAIRVLKSFHKLRRVFATAATPT